MKREEELITSDDNLAYNIGLEIRYAIAASGVDPIKHIPEVDVIIKRRIAEIRALANSPEAEPVAWQHRIMDARFENWSEWRDGKANLSESSPILFEDRPLYAHPPKPELVGWETDAEWDLEMRCANLTENTPFAEVSKLINDLWQQYCLAAEPKPEAEGGEHEKALTAAYNEFARYEWEQGRAWRGPERDALEVFLNAYRAALTAKQTDGREVE